MNETEKRYLYCPVLCGSANCMNKGFFKTYLVRWFYGGKESKKYIPLCPKCVPLWRENIISQKDD